MRYGFYDQLYLDLRRYLEKRYPPPAEDVIFRKRKGESAVFRCDCRAAAEALMDALISEPDVSPSETVDLALWNNFFLLSAKDFRLSARGRDYLKAERRILLDAERFMDSQRYYYDYTI